MRALGEYAAMTALALDKYLDDSCGIPELLREAMRYSLLAGGKRLRPAMLLAAAEMLGETAETALPYACAVEMIHTYSLIHDDLPGMDDDALRRGRPTNHVVFGEGQAILAGDALLSHAFEIMLNDALNHPESIRPRVEAAREIARGAGACGMVAGQSLDLLCERNHIGGENELSDIQLGKTCCMFIYPLRAAGRLAGATDEIIEALSGYALAFGRMFQTADDLLDVEGEEGALGKSVGKDAREGKLTAVSVYGLDGAREKVDRQMELALNALSPLGDRADFFRALVRDMRGRKH